VILWIFSLAYSLTRWKNQGQLIEIRGSERRGILQPSGEGGSSKGFWVLLGVELDGWSLESKLLYHVTLKITAYSLALKSKAKRDRFGTFVLHPVG